MNEPDIERERAWAIADFDAAVSVVGATIGAVFGPLGAILGAGVGSYAKFAVKRFVELRARIDEAGLDEAQIIERLEENEPLAQMIAEVVRGTVETDLEAKRRLLAAAAIRALEDDAVVDEEATVVRTANAIDTTDVRVLAIIGEQSSRGNVFVFQIVAAWPGARFGLTPALSSLESAGLVKSIPMIDTESEEIDVDASWTITGYGKQLLERLFGEGLEDDLRRRDATSG
jgi:hypothetical protein